MKFLKKDFIKDNVLCPEVGKVLDEIQHEARQYDLDNRESIKACYYRMDGIVHLLLRMYHPSLSAAVESKDKILQHLISIDRSRFQR